MRSDASLQTIDHAVSTRWQSVNMQTSRSRAQSKHLSGEKLPLDDLGMSAIFLAARVPELVPNGPDEPSGSRSGTQIRLVQQGLQTFDFISVPAGLCFGLLT